MGYTKRLLKAAQDKFPGLEPALSTLDYEAFVLHDTDASALYMRVRAASRYLNEVRSDLDPPVFVVGCCWENEPAFGKGGVS